MQIIYKLTKGCSGERERLAGTNHSRQGEIQAALKPRCMNHIKHLGPTGTMRRILWAQKSPHGTAAPGKKPDSPFSQANCCVYATRRPICFSDGQLRPSELKALRLGHAKKLRDSESRPRVGNMDHILPKVGFLL